MKIVDYVLFSLQLGQFHGFPLLHRSKFYLNLVLLLDYYWSHNFQRGLNQICTATSIKLLWSSLFLKKKWVIPHRKQSKRCFGREWSGRYASAHWTENSMAGSKLWDWETVLWPGTHLLTLCNNVMHCCWVLILLGGCNLYSSVPPQYIWCHYCNYYCIFSTLLY